MPPTMRRCPDCKAPNPESRAVCYACGQSLSKAPAGAPAPGERTYPCRNCDAAVPFSASACPGCGRVVRPGESPALSGVGAAAPADGAIPSTGPSLPPDGWQVEPLPDGTLRLHRTTWARLSGGAGGSSAALFATAVFVLYMFFGIAGRGGYVGANARGAQPPAWPVIFAVVLLALGGVASLVWTVFGRHELRAGPGLLEVRWRLWGWYRRRQMDSAVLRVETSEHHGGRGGPYVRRSLRAENLGTSLTLVSDQRSTGLLSGALDNLVGRDRTAELGLYLSKVTGWPFVDPANGRY